MDTFIQTIEAYCDNRGISETTFGNLAMKDSRFVSELRDGREIRRATAARVRQYMADNPPDPAPSTPAAFAGANASATRSTAPAEKRA